MTSTKRYDVKDLALAEEGKRRIEWADRQMPVLAAIRARFERELPLSGHRISACLHVTTETANLMRTLKAGGADVVLCASNPLSTQDDVAAALVEEFDISVFAIKGEDHDTYYSHIEAAVDHKPHLTMDDGADVIGVLHSARREQLGDIIAGTEETTTGVIRLKALEAEGKLGFPIIAVNDALTKHLFDNRYGTGQSTIDGIIRATNVLLAGKKFVIAGYGWVGRGVASRARGLGAQVIVTEVDPMPALEASMDGFDVMPMEEAAKVGDIFCTATGDKHVITGPHMELMKDGAILSNTGHFNVEIDIPALRELAVERRVAREFVEEFTLSDGRRIYLVAEGRLVNLSAAEGHPALVMDMSFANQALGVEYAVQHAAELDRKVYPVPDVIDQRDRAAQARDDGRGDRHAHRGAGEVPGLVGRGNLKASSPQSRPGFNQVAAVGAISPERIVRLEEDGPRVVLLDQRRLPDEEVELDCRSAAEVAEAIRAMVVRGAPAIGVAAGTGSRSRRCAARISTPPRRVSPRLGRRRSNLAWALGAAPLRPVARASARAPPRRGRPLPHDVQHMRRSSSRPGTRALTHCNAGGLATGGYGSAVGALRTAWERGLLEHVLVDETRPLLQGARLTAWELEAAGIPHAVIVDSAAASLMARGEVDLVVTGADRIAANGDTANKIGTYALAVLAAHHGIPLYVVAPTSTVDLATPTGAGIPIEERDPAEVTSRFPARNPAFDVTPGGLIAAIVTEDGVHRAPYAESLARVHTAA